MQNNKTQHDYTWDLTLLYKNQAAYEEELQIVQALLDSVVAFQDRICESKQALQAFFLQYEALNSKLHKLSIYPKMCTDVEPENEISQQNFARVMTLMQNVHVATTFIPLEIIQHKDMVEKWLRDDDMHDYRYPISEILRTIPHRLDAETENLMANVEEICHISEDTYDSFRLKFQDVIVEGKAISLHAGNFQQFMHHADRSVRKQAYEQYYGEYKYYQNVFSNILCGHVKGQILKARIYHFSSALQASLFEDQVNEPLFRKVLHMANDVYRPYLHTYFRLRKNIMHVEEQHPYDIQVPLVKDIHKSYNIEESFTILKEAFAPLGSDYVEMLDQMYQERWIDVLPRKGKRGGAYASGTHEPHSFILLNFTGEYASLSTLAHEIGHAMHSYYAMRTNRPLLSNYRIFVAEVASTVNELLLNEYLMKHCESTQEKAYLLDNILMQLIGTLYRQPMYAQFEVTIYELLESGQALSSQVIRDVCRKLYEAYFGESVIVDELQGYSCYAIPHYYYNFYVYKYALGMATAIFFTQRILEGDVEAYRLFLSKGGSESPIEELINSGVHPDHDVLYHNAYTYFKTLLDKFHNIMMNNKA